jgi:hypothetical protein
MDARGLNRLDEGHRQQDGDRWERPCILSDREQSPHSNTAQFLSIVSLPLSEQKPTHSLPRIVGWKRVTDPQLLPQRALS